ncbi:class I SAM-dependent methyltransferase [Fictibacillus sp. Sa2CUA10]|uniref:Class I SAM-dependent methyltransferase n=2 Tax=Fictibacillus norfolkensis TaxID=2762233 RepID=A0ABR8SJS1_9BACL|nr:class I SAM-dependent methyltransferase [Fictibacillus norfolkensis]MBD7963731.1 class I SAM-dependent methyltransferase [Fictibacillus norfolkensis]
MRKADGHLTSLITKNEDVFNMLDSLLRDEGAFWNSFYEDRKKKVPFFVDAPDENLVEYIERGLLKPGRVLELGCGPGRNAIFLAQCGFEVDAVDLSSEGLEWARERAMEKGVDVKFIQGSIFEMDLPHKEYDLIYDSGCFHHVPPHRRVSYLHLLNNCLKVGGHFAITCFDAVGMGLDIPDMDVYKGRSMQGGLGYTFERMREVFSDFEEVELRKMNEISQPADTFGLPFLNAGLFRK